MADARYVVGIDLGTTNCVLAWIDTSIETDEPAAQVLAVPQLVKAGSVADRTQLPSFLYLPSPNELSPESLALPWGASERVVGEFARSRGAEVPGRVVTSAKSWLCSVGTDPSQPILPWGAPDDVPRVSPVDAQAAYLSHLRAAWDAAMPAPLAEQEIYLAVPASFDAAARELTMRAAEQAGLGAARLIEEPQAAFYAWLSATRGGWRDQVRVGDVILVCDVGGGTTDLTLVAVSEEGGNLVLERKAVGDHILLGGDNMDLTLAHAVRAKLVDAGTAIDDWQLRGLVHGCRDAKEKLLAASGPAKAPVVVLGRSRKVVGGAVRTDVERALVEQTLVDGFFPVVARDERSRTVRRMGLQEIGLPYASDPGITRHVAGFVARHREVAPDGPSAVLFNGGVMRAARFRDRMVEVLGSWRGEGGSVRVLQGADADLAVAEGAAVYGLARRGRGVRIRGGTARAYYVGVETAAPAVPGMAPPVKALCIAPFGMEEGSETALPDAEFGLVVGEPAEFRFFGSSVRRNDAPGTVVDGATDLEELAPLEATLTADGQEGRTVPVRLSAHVTEVGTLELWCAARDGARWKLEFNVRQPEP
ncbi:MAG TPA: Hsp70 family protein [Candidatus Binatia bacterium]|jgi:molecular chaperone DnaK (HSP70)|nr:Hsp70 family protein [Candidatus Binatia bacterium]